MKVAKSVTDNSWIVYDKNGIKEGLLSKERGKYVYIDTHISSFENKRQLVEYLGPFKFEQRVFVGDELLLIAGYEVDTKEVFDVNEEYPPTFTKREGSTIKYRAGYYGLSFPHGYSLALCPKESTIEKHGAIGPFKDRMVALQEVSLANSKDKS